MSISHLQDALESVDDPRHPSYILYPLEEILLLLLAGATAGCDDIVETCDWGSNQIDTFLRLFYPYKNEIPSHDTVNNLLRNLDCGVFEGLLSDWSSLLQSEYSQVIAIDGKSCRASRKKGEAPLHLVSAYATEDRLVLGQEAVATKSNEITAIPQLLQRINFRDCFVTIDAMGTQRKIAKAILQGGGEYVLALKGNRPSLHKAVVDYFGDFDGVQFGDKTVDGSHGRIEEREHLVCTDIGWLSDVLGSSGEEAFPGLEGIGVVRRTTEQAGAKSITVGFYLLSASMPAKTFGATVRSHWQIENRLHWMLDVLYREDANRLRMGNGAKNMAVIRRISKNLLEATSNEVKGKKNVSLKRRRKFACWDMDYLRKVLLGRA